MEDVTKWLQASASLLFCWKKVVLGLGDQNNGKLCYTEVTTCLNNFPTTKNNSASAHLKTEPVLLGLQSKKFEKKARALNYW